MQVSSLSTEISKYWCQSAVDFTFKEIYLFTKLFDNCSSSIVNTFISYLLNHSVSVHCTSTVHENMSPSLPVSSSGQATLTAQVQQFKPLFEDLLSGATYLSINPYQCIPFTKIREISKSGVERLVNLYTNTSASDTFSPCLGLGSDTPIVVPLVGSLQHYVREYFDTKYGSEQSIEYISRFDIWFGIIDGHHSNEAVCHLKSTDPSWSNFMWFVTILKGGYSVDRYKQLARFQNHRHNEKFYVSMTFYDELINLRNEYERLRLLKSKPTNVEVAKAYFGSNVSNRTMTMLSSTAIRLPLSVIKVIGKISNEENKDLCIQHHSVQGNLEKEERSTILSDCRMFRNFVKMQSLYASSSFMKPATENHAQVQINTLYRAKKICQLNKFRTVQPAEITEQVKMAQFALQEEKKFLHYLGSSKWPDGMDNIRRNLLQTSTMDQDVKSNIGNDGTVLEPLKAALRRISPNLVAERDASLLTESWIPNSVQHSNGQSPSTSSLPSPPTVSGASTVSNDISAAPLVDVSLKCQSDSLQLDTNRLISKGIQCFNLSWQEFKNDQWSLDAPLIDLVICRPPPFPTRSFVHSCRTNSQVNMELDKAEVGSFPEFCKSVLTPGGYFVVITPYFGYQEWYEAFYKCGFDLMPHPYVIMYDPSTIQKRPTTKYPQSFSEFALVGILPGTSERSFKPDFNSIFHAVNCKVERRFAGIFNVPSVTSKLCRSNSRVPFDTSEQPTELLSELIDIFTPQGGRVLDAYAGAMSTAIGCLKTGRHCIALEKNKECFDAAFQRLRNHLPSFQISNPTRPLGDIDTRLRPSVQQEYTSDTPIRAVDTMNADFNLPTAQRDTCSATPTIRNDNLNDDSRNKYISRPESITLAMPQSVATFEHEHFSDKEYLVQNSASDANSIGECEVTSSEQRMHGGHESSCDMNNNEIFNQVRNCSDNSKVYGRKRVNSISTSSARPYKRTHSSGITQEKTVKLYFCSMEVGQAQLLKGSDCTSFTSQEMKSGLGVSLRPITKVIIHQDRQKLPYPYRTKQMGMLSKLMHLQYTKTYLWDEKK